MTDETMALRSMLEKGADADGLGRPHRHPRIREDATYAIA